MSPDSTSVDRLTTRIAQLETSNIALSGIVATVVTIAIIAMAAVTVPSLGRANAAQHGISSCSASKQTAAPCRPQRPRSAERIFSV
jgi:hypothetical protein